MSGLQHCPFCGADTQIKTYTKVDKKSGAPVLKTAQIHCKRRSCGMAGPLFKGDNARKTAVRHWNDCVFHPTMRKAQTMLADVKTQGEGT
jgi:hypothetical protein